MKTDELLALIKARAEGRTRYIVAIVGAPASGKTTLAAELAAKLGSCASVLPMDGFHLDNSVLQERGLLARKGAPETFDAQGFVALLERVLRTPEVRYPTFDRQGDCTRPDRALKRALPLLKRLLCADALLSVPQNHLSRSASRSVQSALVGQGQLKRCRVNHQDCLFSGSPHPQTQLKPCRSGFHPLQL